MCKKSLFIKTSVAIFCLVSTLVSGSCEKGAEPNTSDGLVSYSINWEKALSACSIPKTVHYCIYPSGNSPMIQMEGDATKFNLVLPPDTYRLLIFNCDADNIDFRNLNKFETAEAYIRATTKADASSQPGIIPLYGLVIDSLAVKQGQSSEIAISPTPLVQNIALNINVAGMEHIQNCQGSLSGVASSLNLSRQSIVPDQPTTVTFDTQCTEKGISARVMILGVAASKDDEPDPEPIKNVLSLDIRMKDGTTVTSTADLGDKLSGITGPDIKVDIEATVTQALTFTVTINHWEVAPGDGLIID